MQKFKLRNKDQDTLMEICRNSTMFFIKINHLLLYQFFYAHISQKARERNELIPVRKTNIMTSQVFFLGASKGFSIFF